MSKYRPANGTEGEWFKEKFCYRCRYLVFVEDIGSEDCSLDILGDAETFDINEENYPDEWTYNEKGKPICTKFEDTDNMTILDWNKDTK